MNSADLDPDIMGITLVFGDPHAHRQAGMARQQLPGGPILDKAVEPGFSHAAFGHAIPR
jgi:hypothetical protein